MARVTDTGISGAVGNMIFYTMNGKHYVRQKPGKRKKKRNQPVNPLNTIFGTVSTHGSAMIKSMNKSFLFPFKLATYNRLRGWMRNQYAENHESEDWRLSVKNSGMCQINEGIDLRDFWKTELTVTDNGNGNIAFNIPEFNPTKELKVPSRTMKVNIKLIVVTSTFKEKGTPCNLCTKQYSFDYSNNPVPAQQFVLQTAAGTGSIALAVMALEFETQENGNNEYNKDPRWLPAAVITMGRLQ
jgi:hypothetical protein